MNINVIDYVKVLGLAFSDIKLCHVRYKLWTSLELCEPRLVRWTWLARSRRDHVQRTKTSGAPTCITCHKNQVPLQNSWNVYWIPFALPLDTLIIFTHTNKLVFPISATAFPREHSLFYDYNINNKGSETNVQSNKVKVSRGKDEYKNFDKHDEKEINNENRLKGPNKGELSFVSRGTLRTKVMIYGAVGAVPAKHRLKLKVYVCIT